MSPYFLMMFSWLYTQEKKVPLWLFFLCKNFLFVYHIKKLCNEQVIITQQKSIEPQKSEPRKTRFPLYLPT